MIQQDLFTEQAPKPGLERKKEVVNPFSLIRRTALDVWKVLYFSILLSAVALAVLRFTAGLHPEGEEVVVISTPLMIAFLALRLMRTGIAPLSDEEVKSQKTQYISLHDLATALFAVGLLLILLALCSCAIYLYFGIEWAVSIVLVWSKGLCLVLLVLAILAFFTSGHGKKQLRRAVRGFMALPDGVRSFLEGIIPMRSPRLHAKRF